MKKKSVALITAMVMLFGVIVGGTVAYLTDRTDKIENTFTVGNIDIDLTETKPVDKTAKMIPGNPIEKDPTVTVKANSEACYLFVKIEKSTNLDNFISYTVADGWTALSGVDGVYYRTVDATTADTVYSVLKDNKVTVKDTVTKTMMDAITDTTKPTLTFIAYACQSANMTNVNTAWTAVSTAADA